MKALLDAGALVGVERRDRRVGAMLRVLQQRRVPLWTSAAVDAHLALLVDPGDQVLTGDRDDLALLLAARRVRATLVDV